MINKTNLGDLFTGMVILANSIPASLTDANGDNLRDGFIQSLHDASDELELGREVNWNATGAAPDDIIPIKRSTLAELKRLMPLFAACLDEVPDPRGDRDE